MRNRIVLLFVILSVVFLVSCKDKLSVELINQESYKTASNKIIKVKYYELEDKSLGFIKIKIPEVKELTLPRLMSASGAKYTDESAFMWWIKGENGTLYRISDNGEWDKLYEECSLMQE
ncbi:MAG: MliC family protein [Bacteroidales bacterium]